MSSVAEPKPRKDGKCVVCGKPITTRSRYSEQDAFCSAAHCKEYFGAQDLSGPPHPDNQPQED
jgi:hypothetical protein